MKNMVLSPPQYLFLLHITLLLLPLAKLKTYEMNIFWKVSYYDKHLPCVCVFFGENPYFTVLYLLQQLRSPFCSAPLRLAESIFARYRNKILTPSF